MTEYNEIISKIEEIRNNKGWSLYRLSKESDVSLSTLRNLYKRNNYPSYIITLNLCNGLGISLSELHGGDKKLTERERKLLLHFNALSKTNKKTVETMINALENKEK
jgi:transcriptional regulator with XRE-family HTH domain